MSVAVGIVIVNLVCWAIVVFGMRPFQQYERFAWISQLIVLFVLIGCAGPNFDVSTVSIGNSATVAANRLSFLSMCLYVPNSWSAAASDFFVYYPETTPPLKVASLTMVGLWLSFGLVYLIGYDVTPTKDSEWTTYVILALMRVMLLTYEQYRSRKWHYE